MANAPASDQLQLLKVAELDAAIARLEREAAKHPLREEIGAIVNAQMEKDRELKTAEARLPEARRKLAKAEGEAEALASQISQKEAQLASGAGMDSRMLLAMQEEVGGLRTLLDKANDTEFAALEVLEAAEEAVGKAEREIAGLTDRVRALTAELQAAVGRIETEKNGLLEERSSLFVPLADPLKAIYERLRERGGYTVLAMKPNGRTDGGVELSPKEVDAIRNAPEDEICIAEEYGCIVVRC